MFKVDTFSVVVKQAHHKIPCDILFDRLITNQIALLFPVLSEQSWVKCLGLTEVDPFSPHHITRLAHPLPTSSQFFAHPRRAPSLACSVSTGKGKETAATQLRDFSIS